MIQKLLATVQFLLLGTVVVHTQVPQVVCYQVVATDPSGRELINPNIKFRIFILKGTSFGIPEGHSGMPDVLGLFER